MQEGFHMQKTNEAVFRIQSELKALERAHYAHSH